MSAKLRKIPINNRLNKIAGMKMKTSPLAPSDLGQIHAVPGIQLGTMATGMKYRGRDDVMVMVADAPARIAGSLTTSRTCSAAVDWCRDVLTTETARAVLVNAGVANAFTGRRGVESVERCADAAAKALGTAPNDILLASTGVIGEPMEDSLITDRFAELIDNLDATSWMAAAKAIMTTDTFAKAASRQVDINGHVITLTGIAKGSGMIAPDMATMLAFIATDADIGSAELKTMTASCVDESFNAITVDGDTSTSDTVIVMATAVTGPKLSGDALNVFRDALKDLMVELATQVVKDGEGASKFITIDVRGAEDDAAARRMGLAIANSPLVKTAIAGEDANWGRIIMAVGKSGEFADRDRLTVAMGGVVIARDGGRAEDYDEAPVAEHMKGRHINILVDLGIGDGQGRVWTCDLTQGYIEINADYRS
jgi:glutamate N-acetyltransferase/amino-acid N-acetyltransferase